MPRISAGIVAEKRAVCLSLSGVWERMRPTSGAKPMSSILSASSRTR
jgi:hypothetical protein